MGQPGLASQLTPVQPLCPHPFHELRDINAPTYRPILTSIHRIIFRRFIIHRPIHPLFPLANCRAREPEALWPAVGDSHRAVVGSPGNARRSRP